jgi:hypothetical protein
VMRENGRRYFELVELARICWRNSQSAGTQEATRTLRRMAEEYLQEAAELDDGKVPDIGLVDNESGWIDAKRKQPPHGRRVLALWPMDNEGYESAKSRMPGSSRGGTDCGGTSFVRPGIGADPKISTGARRFQTLLMAPLSSPSRILGITHSLSRSRRPSAAGSSTRTSNAV